MQHPVLAQAIRDTLLEKGQLSLPGLGLLYLESHPARLVRTEAMLYPPRKSPVFVEGMEGGEVSPWFYEQYALLAGETPEEAAAQTAMAFHELREALLAGEDVVLEEVGRFFVNERGETDFVPSPFNYDLDMYGLAPVAARPVIKRSAAEAAAEAIRSRQVRPVATVPASKRWSRPRDKWFLPLMAGLLLLTIAAATWMIYAPAIVPPADTVSDRDDDDEDMDTYAIEEDALREGSDFVEIDDADDDEEEEVDYSAAAPESAPPPTRPDAWTHTIIVGHFGDPNNVANALQRIADMGMVGDSRLTGSGLTRVMVRVHADYEDPAEVLTLIRDTFDPKAFLKEGD